MQDDLVAAVRESVHEIAIAMLDMVVENDACTVMGYGDSADPIPAEVVAVVELSGGLEGGVRLASPTTVALALAGRLAGETPAAMNGEAADAYGELCNMVAGGVQSRISEVCGAVNLTPPRVYSDGAASEGQGDYERVQHRFRMAAGTFLVEAYYLP